MIENHAQCQVTQEQIQRLEQALEQLLQTASTAEFMAQAPAVVEHIRRMRAEIDVYLGLPDIESDTQRVSLQR
jgi:chromosome condensin MukBEF ATPase and DNA-binding subunit MukB